MRLTPEKRPGPEYLDLPPDAYSFAELEESLADIRAVNRWLGDRRALIKHLAAKVGEAPRFSILDVATGSADLPVEIVRWGRKKGKEVMVTAIDINEGTVEIARKVAAQYAEITVEVADGLNLPYPDRSFDVVLCCKSCHHLSEADNVRLIREMLRVSRRGFLVLDLRRSWVAWFLITALTQMLTRNRLTRHDGPLSVLRSFTDPELRRLAEEAGATKIGVRREPFWLLVLSGEPA